MKVIKYIVIGILGLFALAIASTFAMAFGSCAILGFIILCGLDSLGFIEMKDSNINVMLVISFVIGLIIMVATGQFSPE